MSRLIDYSPAKVIIQHGLLDMILIANGSALGIQNITFGGKQGFQKKPTRDLIVYGKEKGKVHTERGLTFFKARGSGHMIPRQYLVAFCLLFIMLTPLFSLLLQKTNHLVPLKCRSSYLVKSVKKICTIDRALSQRAVNCKKSDFG